MSVARRARSEHPEDAGDDRRSAEPHKERDPPPQDDGDIATPKTQPPSDDDKPLE